MMKATDIMDDREVAKLSGLSLWTFQRRMKHGFKPGELDFRKADPVACGASRVWLRADVERVWTERITVPRKEAMA